MWRLPCKRNLAKTIGIAQRSLIIPGLTVPLAEQQAPPAAAAAAAAMDGAAAAATAAATAANAAIAAAEQRAQLLAATCESPVVFYHYPCPDGVFAALAATLHFRSRGLQVRYVPFAVYRTPSLDALQLQRTDTVFLLDYAGPPGWPQALAAAVSHVVVLDHHKTAAEQLLGASTSEQQQQQQQGAPPALPPNVCVLIDMDRSGAAIARDVFRPALSEPLQQMFRWVEDADLWRWQLPGSRAFHAGLGEARLELSADANPAIWEALLALQPAALLEQGERVLQRQEALIAAAVSSARPYQLGGAEGLARGWGSCLGVQLGADRDGAELAKWRSSLGSALAQASRDAGRRPVGLVAYVEPGMAAGQGGAVKVSLRSVDGFDTTTVSAAFGGGGHAAASSCIISSQQLAGWQAMAA